MRLFDNIVIGLNRLRTARLKERFAPENVLLLLPHCLQRQDCEAAIRKDIHECKACGRCKIKALKELADRFGVSVCVASGGRVAQQRARAPEVRVIVAVACRRELAEGIRAVFPKRVFSVPNTWPNGPCKDTDVDVGKVEAMLARLIRDSRS